MCKMAQALQWVVRGRGQVKEVEEGMNQTKLRAFQC